MEKAKRMAKLLDIQGLKDAIDNLEITGEVVNVLIDELESRLTGKEFIAYSESM